MKVMGKGLLCAMFNLISIGSISAESSTCIGRLLLKTSECKRSKTFINDTDKSLVVKWQVKCSTTDVFYVQTPLVCPGYSCTLDFAKAVNFIQKKSGKKCDTYELDLFLGVVTKAPIRPRTQFDYRALHGPEKGLFLTKNEFLGYKTFRLYSTERGQILYEGEA